MVTSGSRTDNQPLDDLPSGVPEADAGSVRPGKQGVFVLGAPESGCQGVATWLHSSGFYPALTSGSLRLEISVEEPSDPPTVVPTEWAEFLLAMAEGSWELPPPGDLLVAARSSLVPAFHERLRDAIDCAHGLPIVVSDEHLLPILPIIGPSTLDRFIGVLVVRNPLAIARTLSVKFDISVAEGLSLWEHYMAAAFATARHLPMVVTGTHPSGSKAMISADVIENLLSPTTSGERIPGYQSPAPDPPNEFHWLDATEEEFQESGTRHQIELWDRLTEAVITGRLLVDFPASFEHPSALAVEVLHDGARHRTGRMSKLEHLRAIREEQANLAALTRKSEEMLATANATLSDTMTERDQLRSTVTDLMERLRTMAVNQAEGHRKADRLAKENDELHATVLELIHDGEELEKVYKSESWRIGFAITGPIRRLKQAIRGTPEIPEL